MLRHLRAFQRIGHVNGNTRVAGTPGHKASADYVAGKLREAGYQVTLQEFTFPFFGETAPATLAQVAPDAKPYVRETDFLTMTYSGSGSVEAVAQPVDLALTDPAASTSGCEAADFAGFTRGNIALLQRGTCTFEIKVANAQAAGAAAVIVMNQGTPDRTAALSGTLGRPFTIPALGVSFAVGQDLASPATTRVKLTATTIAESRTTHNVIAETRQGRKDNVVFLGAHLDSVQAGPGINDNGTGSAALLELALQVKAQKVKHRNALRFAWWSAEEFGLLGSEYHVSQLSFEQQLDIAMYLNFDMIGSPNYFRGIYDGDDSDKVGNGPGPVGSAPIEKAFERYFASRRLPYEGTDFSGRSDYGPFIAVGIPSGGLFTGAEGIKTAEQARRYGGQAGVAFDPCYHKSCDTLANVNVAAMDTNADAIAHVAATFADDTSPVNGDRLAKAKRAASVKKLAYKARGAIVCHDHEVVAS
jgi:Zn-dependent M28 family amino/carboxypeptidase